MFLLNVNPAVAFRVVPASLNCTCVSVPPGVLPPETEPQYTPPVEFETSAWLAVPETPLA